MTTRTDKQLMWKTLSSKYIVKEPWLTARKDVVQLPNGQINDSYWCLEYPEFISIVAITTDGHFIIERQYRHAIDSVCFEIPAGVAEKGEAPLQAAQRELLEETGYSGGQWSPLITTAPNASACNNFSHAFLAVGVEKVARQHLDRTEDLDVMLMTREQVFTLLKADEFKQATMAAPLWKYFAMSTTK